MAVTEEWAVAGAIINGCKKTTTKQNIFNVFKNQTAVSIKLFKKNPIHIFYNLTSDKLCFITAIKGFSSIETKESGRNWRKKIGDIVYALAGVLPSQ